MCVYFASLVFFCCAVNNTFKLFQSSKMTTCDVTIALRETAATIQPLARRIRVLESLLDEARAEAHASNMCRLRQQCLEEATSELFEALQSIQNGTLDAYTSCISIDDDGLPPHVVKTTVSPPTDAFRLKICINEARGKLSIQEDMSDGMHVDDHDISLTDAALRHTLLNDDDADSYQSTTCVECNYRDSDSGSNNDDDDDDDDDDDESGGDSHKTYYPHTTWRNISVDLYLYYRKK